MYKRLLIVLVSTLAYTAAYAQLETTADFKRQVYESEFTGGIMFHTKGYGANFRLLKLPKGFYKQGFEWDLVNLRHPKEVKIFQFNDNGRVMSSGSSTAFTASASVMVRNVF